MAFFENVKSAFINCLNFKGRTNRKDFWYYVLFLVIMLIFLYLPALKITEELKQGSCFFISPLLLTMPLFSLACRRLNDARKTKWWWKALAFFCIYSLLLFIVIIFHHPDLEFLPEPDTNLCACGEETDIDSDSDPYAIAFLIALLPPLLFSFLPFLPLLPLFLLALGLENIFPPRMFTSGILEIMLVIWVIFILVSPFILLYALSLQGIKEDEENTTEKDEDAAEKDKKLGTAGKVFLFVVAALVIGIPVLEIIRLTSAAS